MSLDEKIELCIKRIEMFQVVLDGYKRELETLKKQKEKENE